jgi:DNA-binding response OmpR family regulator
MPGYHHHVSLAPTPSITAERVHLLIVEDELTMAETLRDGLSAEGFDVALAHDGDEGFRLGCDAAVDLIILDIMLPKRNGYRVCRDLRSAGVSTPILMLTAKQGDLDEAEALDTGADDFLSKPFSFVVLLARLRALQRRRTTIAGTSDGRVQRGDLVVDVRQRRCWRGEHSIELTARELDLLAAIVGASPDPVSKTTLLEQVWGAEFEGDPNVIEVYVGYLRRKIDQPYGRAGLQTVRGLGYRFDADR